MYYYRIFGLNVCSDLEITEAKEIDKTDNIDLNIHYEEMKSEYIQETEAELKKDFGCIFGYGKTETFIRYVHQGAFFIRNGNEIAYNIKPDASMNFVKQIILCFTMSAALAQRQIPVMQGSGVVINDKAYVISGDSGAGKSTLTGELLNNGAGFMSDDMVALDINGEEIKAIPSFPLRKLCPDAVEQFGYKKEDIIYLPDAGKEKYAIRIPDEEYTDTKKVLGGIVVVSVGDCDEPVLTEVKGIMKLKVLTDNIYRSDAYADMGYDRELLNSCMAIIQSVPIYRLVRPRDKMTVKEQVEVLFKNL